MWVMFTMRGAVYLLSRVNTRGQSGGAQDGAVSWNLGMDFKGRSK